MDEGLTTVQRKVNEGKPRLPAKTRMAGIKLTPEQHRVIEARAERAKMSVSAWMRSVSLQAASRPSNDGYIRIREPDGTMT